MQEIIITAIDGQKTNGVHKDFTSAETCEQKRKAAAFYHRGSVRDGKGEADTQYCLTVHHFTSHGRSTSITKKCASRSECHSVGCHHSRDSEHTECRSCCEGMICNVELPTNHSNAVLAVTRAPGTSGGPAPRLQVPGLPALVWASVLLLL
ncbi:ly6/PLAUR domain-containing protein 6B isoform X2 [Vulpes vulpes]|uniref:Ly6/PLAUR domain-containing protein 6B isoform X2 n=1 Tax=Vulpes vulpes TaxID=9627 RepID=A0A3Q7T348_VULVU|nr:ly6/PLAUR domain-containing protein 6B isoform X2 [Vulpes vulpes]